MVYCLKEYERPNQKRHLRLILFETRRTLLNFLDYKMEQQEQNHQPSVWRIESMVIPTGAIEILQAACLNEMSGMNRLWGSLIVWPNDAQPTPYLLEGGGGVKKNKKK